MAILSCITRGNSSPQGKSKVYFCCHPDDFNLMKSIADEILAEVNCAIFYTAEAITDKEAHLRNLSEMNLLVFPVTTRFLTKPSFARDVDFAFAKENHIPILPLMQEDGLDEIFNRVCGDLQYLDKNARDATAISYEEKFKAFLHSILVGDETAERIRAAFDAYIFLSYRKKDRIHAKELMRLIHENDFCRDVAIWYDEFLTPGENFNDTIADALKKSAVFALAVTPNLVNEENYVMSVEYPMARDTKKTVLPIELVPTNREELEKAYRDIREAVNSKNAEALRDALRDAFQWITLRYRDDDPEHNYLIGLAYLSGVDVEKNPTRALELITQAAESNHPEAIKKLVTMYENGEGVERDLEAAIGWRERLVDYYQKVFEISSSETDAKRYLDALLALAGAYFTVCEYKNAYATYQKTLEKILLLSQKQTLAWTLLYQAKCYDGLGKADLANEELTDALKHLNQALKIRETIFETDGSTSSRYELWESYIHCGSLAVESDLLIQASVYFTQAVELIQVLHDEKQTDETALKLATTHIHCGDLYCHHDFSRALALTDGKIDLDKEDKEACLVMALKSYIEAKNLLFARLDHSDVVDIRIKSVLVCCSIADICLKLDDIDLANTIGTAGLVLAKRYFEDTSTLQAKKTLLTCFLCMGEREKKQNGASCAVTYYTRALEIAEELCEKYATLDSLYTLADCCDTFGDLAMAQNELCEALSYYRRAFNARESITRTTGSFKARKSLELSCLKLQALAQEFGDYSLAFSFTVHPSRIIGLSGTIRQTLSDITYMNTLLHSDSIPKHRPDYLPDANDAYLLDALAMHRPLLLQLQGAEANYKKDFDTAFKYYVLSVEAIRELKEAGHRYYCDHDLFYDYFTIAQLAQGYGHHDIAVSYYLKELEEYKNALRTQYTKENLNSVTKRYRDLIAYIKETDGDPLSLILDYLTLYEALYREQARREALDGLIDAATLLAQAYREAKAPIFKRLMLAVKCRHYRAKKKKTDRKHAEKPSKN